MESNLITIGIPTRNRASLLQRALKSVLTQSYRKIEVIVSDNSSNDETKALLSEITDDRVRFFSHFSMVSMVENFNYCLANASGDYFLLLSDDDWIEPDFIEIALSRFAENSSVKMVYARAWVHLASGQKVFASNSASLIECGEATIKHFFQMQREVWLCATILPITDMRKCGGYSDGFYNATDTAMWMNVASGGMVAYIAMPLAHYDARHACSADKVSIAIEACGSIFDRFYSFPKSNCSELEKREKRALYIATQAIAQAVLLRQQGGSVRKLALWFVNNRPRLGFQALKLWLKLAIVIAIPAWGILLAKRIRFQILQ